MSSEIYAVIGIFLIIYVSFRLLKTLGKTFLGCLTSIFWTIIIVWIFNRFFC